MRPAGCHHAERHEGSFKPSEQEQFQDEDDDPNMDHVKESSGPVEEVDFISLHGVDPLIHAPEKGSFFRS